MSADAFHVTAPPDDGDGAFRVMRNAMRDAGIEPQQVDYINAHGTSTEVGDRAETMAIKRAFGEHAYKVAVSSTKSMTGHLLGGAGGLEAGISVMAIRDQIAPPTINHENPDAGCDLDYVPAARPPHEDRICPLQQLRLRRDQRLSDFQEVFGIAAWSAQTGAEVHPMKIVVAIKQVPARDSQLRIAPSGKWIEEARSLLTKSTSRTPTPWKPGLQLKEKHGGEVVALCAGPARAAQTIREALAKGADRAIHIEEDDGGLRSAGRGAAAGGGAARAKAPT